MTMPIMGTDYPNKKGPLRRFEIRICKPGEAVELRPEPKNKVDPRAIAIYSERDVQLGYVPGEKCQWLTSMLARGVELNAIFQEETAAGGLIRVGVDCVPTLPPARPKPEFSDWPPPDPGWED
jgi:hypothetical protein